MTIHNKAQIRYRILDRCFRDTTKDYTFTELLDVVNKTLAKSELPHTISERQLYSDIAYMKSDSGYGADIVNVRVPRTDEQGRKRFYSAYRYADPRFSIDRLPVSHQQMRFLQAYLCSFEASIDSNVEPWVKKTVSRLCDWVGTFDSRPIMRYDYNSLQGGVRMKEVHEYLRVLMEAIDSRHSIILYLRTYEEDSICHFHPVFMKKYLHRWYVLGVTTENPEQIIDVPLDNIYAIARSEEKYIECRFNPNEYFDDIIGVDNPDTEPVDIHFWAYDWGAYYLHNNPIHSSQRTRWFEENGERVLDVHIHVKINRDLRLTMDKFFECTKILAPQELVDRQIASLKKAMARHEVGGVFLRENTK